MNAIQTEWKFKLLSLTTGRVIEKAVIGFETYEAAAECAKSCVPEASQPVIVKSYQ